jgi:hypothetical protein
MVIDHRANAERLPTKCDIGAKISSQSNNDGCRGYKIHFETADGQIIIATLLTSASVHGSQAAILLMTLSSQ